MVGFALGDILIWMTVGMSKPLGRALSDRKELPFRANFIRVGLVSPRNKALPQLDRL